MIFVLFIFKELEVALYICYKVFLFKIVFDFQDFVFKTTFFKLTNFVSPLRKMDIDFEIKM